MTHSVLALDLATTTGWALHQSGLQRPFFGAIVLPGKARDIGKRAEALRAFMAEKHSLYGFTDIVFEEQHVGQWKRPGQDEDGTRGGIPIDTVRMLLALSGMAEWFAYRVKARCFSVPISTWRKHFIGRGGGFKRRPKSEGGGYLPGHDPKELAIRKCASFGWHTDVADAAEGCGILDFYLHLLAQADPQVSIPWRDRNLFGGRLNVVE